MPGCRFLTRPRFIGFFLSKLLIIKLLDSLFRPGSGFINAFINEVCALINEVCAFISEVCARMSELCAGITQARARTWQWSASQWDFYRWMSRRRGQLCLFRRRHRQWQARRSEGRAWPSERSARSCDGRTRRAVAAHSIFRPLEGELALTPRLFSGL